jgi:polar amino acid transport system substrate-binding protein
MPINPLQMATFQRGLFITTALFALAVLRRDPGLGDLIVPTPYLRVAICPGTPYDDDRRFRGVLNAWLANRGIGWIRELIVADLTKFGFEPGDLPPEVSF